jgi:hypothetical protein
MVDTVQQKVQHEEEGSIWEPLLDVEQESMEAVFEQCPEEVAEEEASHCSSESHRRINVARLLSQGLVEQGDGDGSPDEWDHIPWCHGKHFEVSRSKQLSWT